MIWSPLFLNVSHTELDEWDEWDGKVKKEYPKNESELFRCLKNDWENLPYKCIFFIKLLERMVRICQEVIKENGFWVKR